MSDEITRIENEDDLDRCQHVIPTQGQCGNRAHPRSTFCLAHGGNRAGEQEDKRNLKNLRIHKWNMRLSELGESIGIKSLRDEIAVLRILLEETINKCQDASDLILTSGPISDLVMKIEKIVTSCHKLEVNMGEVLDKQAIVQFSDEVVLSVTEVLNSLSDKLTAEEIGELLTKVGDDVSTSISRLDKFKTEDDED